MATGPNVAIVERFNCTCNNQRFRSAGKWKQPLFLQHCALHKFHMIEGQNTHDQIPSYVFHSFLVEVQTNPTHARIIATWAQFLKGRLVLIQD